MADYFTHHTAEAVVPCTPEEFTEVEALLAQEQDDEHGFEVAYIENSVYLYADYNGTSGNLPASFCERLGRLLEQAKMPFLEVGVANICSKARMGSHSGGYWRLYPDGSIVSAREIWPEEIAAIRAIVNYNWDDERADYIEECGDGPDEHHVFEALVHVNNFLEDKAESPRDYIPNAEDLK